MARFKQFHDPELSIWQAAVGEVEAKAAAGKQVEDVVAPQVISGRPDDLDGGYYVPIIQQLMGLLPGGADGM